MAHDPQTPALSPRSTAALKGLATLAAKRARMPSALVTLVTPNLEIREVAYGLTRPRDWARRRRGSLSEWVLQSGPMAYGDVSAIALKATIRDQLDRLRARSLLALPLGQNTGALLLFDRRHRDFDAATLGGLTALTRERSEDIAEARRNLSAFFLAQAKMLEASQRDAS